MAPTGDVGKSREERRWERGCAAHGPSRTAASKH